MPTKNTTKRSRTRERSVTDLRQVAVQFAGATNGVPVAAQFRRWARAALERPAAITLRVVGEDEARELNRRYRGKDHATNVLTFAYAEDGGADIVLCAPIIERE